MDGSLLSLLPFFLFLPCDGEEGAMEKKAPFFKIPSQKAVTWIKACMSDQF
jgi:hypothetical protein